MMVVGKKNHNIIDLLMFVLYMPVLILVKSGKTLRYDD